MQYLLILDYQSDAERKRIDYILDKWSSKEKSTVTKPKGMVLLFEGEDVSEFLEELYSRINPDSSPVKTFKISESSHEVEKKVRRLEYTSTRTADVIDTFVNYLIAKLNGAFEYSNGPVRVFNTQTRKGKARIEIMTDVQEKVRYIITVEGYGDAVDYIAGRIDDEMRVFLGDAT
jgi:hypothetical protein